MISQDVERQSRQGTWRSYPKVHILAAEGACMGPSSVHAGQPPSVPLPPRKGSDGASDHCCRQKRKDARGERTCESSVFSTFKQLSSTRIWMECRGVCSDQLPWLLMCRFPGRLFTNRRRQARMPLRTSSQCTFLNPPYARHFQRHDLEQHSPYIFRTSSAPYLHSPWLPCLTTADLRVPRCWLSCCAQRLRLRCIHSTSFSSTMSSAST